MVSRLVQQAPREVVLVYDLAKDPSANRLPGAARMLIPAPLVSAPVQVGIPVYPEPNANQKSYLNVTQSLAKAETVSSYLPFVVLPGERFVFAVAEGEDFLRSRDFLVMIDLASGVEHAFATEVDIPKDRLQKPGENPEFVKITGLERDGGNSVRLLVPKSEYGIDSLAVQLPR